MKTALTALAMGVIAVMGVSPALAALTTISPAQTVGGTIAPGELLSRAKQLLAGAPAAADNPLLVVDKVAARKILQQAVLLRNADTAAAQLMLAKLMLHGDGGPVDIASAVRLLQSATQAGSGEAADVLADEYLNQGRTADAQTAFETALRLGYYPAGLALADQLAASDADKAASLRSLALGALDQQARHGIASAATALAEYYRQTDADGKRALSLYEAASQAGDVRALYWVGKLEADPTSGVTAPAKALTAFEAAAKAGSVDAAREIVLAANASSLPVSAAEAQLWLQRLLKVEDIGAELIYANQSQTTLEQRQALSDSIFARLQAAPFPDLDALAAAAASYRDGHGLLPNATRALALYERGMRLGDKDMTLEYAKLLIGTPSLVTRQNTAVAYAQVKALADAGSSSADVVLGDMLLQGFGVEADRQTAIALYEKAAKQAGSVVAMLDLARLYVTDPVAANRPTAVQWYRSAITAGSKQALVDLADIFATDDIVPRDRLQAIDLYTLGIDAGAQGALDRLTALYAATAGTQSVELLSAAYQRAIASHYPDAALSFAHFLIAQGDPGQALDLLERPEFGARVDVQLTLAQIYLGGALPAGIDLRKAEAALATAAQKMSADPMQRLAVASAMLAASDDALSKQAAAILDGLTTTGYAPAETALGRAALLGIGMPVDAKAGLAHLQVALAAGDPQARLELADAYSTGANVKADPAMAKALYEQALALAPDDPRANLGLGRLYAKQQLGPDNAALGIPYLRKAAATGDNSARVALASVLLKTGNAAADAAEGTNLLLSASQAGAIQAFADLASYHSSATSAPIDPPAAFGYDYAAAQRNDVPSMLRVGTALVEGFGATRDMRLGMDWLLKAGRLGSADALFELYKAGTAGQLGWFGRGEAPLWLKNATAAGSGSAMYRTALALLATNLPADHDRAVDLLKRAADGGHSQSKKMLGKLGVIPISEE